MGSSAASAISLVSFISGGSLRWMSPELLDPSKFNAPDPRPTRESDCFALGMVIYEVRARQILRSPPAIVNALIGAMRGCAV